MFLENAVTAGIKVADFWDMTPRETEVVIDAYVDKKELEGKEMRAHAWMVAALSRSKKMPELDKFLDPPKPKTPEEIEADKRFFEEMRQRYSKRGKT